MGTMCYIKPLCVPHTGSMATLLLSWILSAIWQHYSVFTDTKKSLLQSHPPCAVYVQNTCMIKKKKTEKAKHTFATCLYTCKGVTLCFWHLGHRSFEAAFHTKYNKYQGIKRQKLGAQGLSLDNRTLHTTNPFWESQQWSLCETEMGRCNITQSMQDNAVTPVCDPFKQMFHLFKNSFLFVNEFWGITAAVLGRRNCTHIPYTTWLLLQRESIDSVPF